jgi:putative ABC transport system permease protein
MGAALLATSGAALAGCYSSLRAAPAALLRPRAPKAGRRVFLEKVSFVWSRLSFIQKVSVRNLFRYQKRFWMTIAGIAGCTALLVTGFGLRDSIFDVLRWQFDRLTVYDATVGIKEDLVGADRERLMQYFDDAPGIEEYASCFEDTISLRTGEGTLENVALTAAADWDALKDLIHIYPRGGGVVR